jgi:hypothetical protein
MRAAGIRLGLAVVLVAAAGAGSRVWAFDPVGHDIIEATAYRRLLQTAEVPGTGVSGRTLLGALIAQRVLEPPQCFDDEPDGGCSAEALREAPLRSWPRVGSGAADLLIDRQIDERGQCQHFMAQTDDAMSPIDPHLGVPTALATTAYSRCVSLLAAVLDNILRHPRLSAWRVAGMYVLMHAIEDSFSAAHARRDQTGRIVHLLSWKLIDWPAYAWHRRLQFPPETHHAVTDDRDGAFLVDGGRAPNGQECTSFHQAYAVPEECLTERARAAVAAIVDVLVLTYSLRRQAAAAGTEASLQSPAGVAAWNAYVRKHLPWASADLQVSAPRLEAPPRPDVFLGVEGALRPGGWAASLWGGRLIYGPALPFALGLFAGAGYGQVPAGDRLAGSLSLGLYLPLVRRFVVGFSPASIQSTCTTDFEDCAVDGQATVGSLIVRLGRIWLALQGPSWSWSEREFRDSRLALALGWWHERHPDETPIGEAPVTWHPPAADEVHAYHLRHLSALGYLTATFASTSENQTVGAGVELLLDRDRWNQRAGLAPGLAVEYARGTFEGSDTSVVSLAALGRWYLVPDRIALVLAPAVLRVPMADVDRHAVVDVSGRVGLALMLGRIEVRADAPPLSYVSTERWHARPLSVSLALMLR